MNKKILLFLLIITAVSCKKDNIEPLKPKGKPKREIPTKTTNLSDCYKADIAGNSIELQIQNKAEVTTGTLTYAFSGKEVTQGAFKGKWENNILVANYYYIAKGKSKERQIVFKRINNELLEGYGERKTNSTQFKDVTKIKFNENMPLKKVVCN
ncbi:MAG: hypothetical protein CUR32_03805 [Flavobacterium sp.]|nr:MAG: hypothetical protein CUR32_03805 [Flavobacterium sp.] [Flavobacterium sp. FEMGT703F]